VSLTRFGVVGSGWRTRFFLKLAAALPEELAVVGVVARRPESAERVRREWDVASYPDVDALLAAQRPDFMITSVSWPANPGLVADLVGRGVRVLSETPPAPDLDGLRALWARVGGSGMVQVAEQYLMMPGHAARLEVVRRGLIGRPTSVQMSSTHGYHAVSMIRGLLGIGFEPATVSARRFSAPLLQVIDRGGWTDDPEPKPAGTTLATLDFGTGGMGLYDFTDNQWHNPLRSRRILVRGTHGELIDDDVLRLAAPRTLVRSPIIRRQLGYDLDLDGYDTDQLTLDGELLYRNPFGGLRFADEEIAIGTLLRRTAAWATDSGPEPYPLAQACQDHQISLAIDASLAAGVPVTTTPEPWSLTPP